MIIICAISKIFIGEGSVAIIKCEKENTATLLMFKKYRGCHPQTKLNFNEFTRMVLHVCSIRTGRSGQTHYTITNVVEISQQCQHQETGHEVGQLESGGLTLHKQTRTLWPYFEMAANKGC